MRSLTVALVYPNALFLSISQILPILSSPSNTFPQNITIPVFLPLSLLSFPQIFLPQPVAVPIVKSVTYLFLSS